MVGFGARLFGLVGGEKIHVDIKWCGIFFQFSVFSLYNLVTLGTWLQELWISCCSSVTITQLFFCTFSSLVSPSQIVTRLTSALEPHRFPTG